MSKQEKDRIRRETLRDPTLRIRGGERDSHEMVGDTS